MKLIFDNSHFLKALAEAGASANADYTGLITRLGVKPRDSKVVVIVIAKNEWDGHEAYFELFGRCEKKIQKAS